MPNCSGCGSDVGEGVKFCPKCGQPQAAAAAAPGGNGGGYAGAPPPSGAASSVENQNVMGAVAYVTIIPAILFLVLEPYNKNRFIRFHSFQCLFFALGLFALWMAYTVLTFIVGMIPVLGGIVMFILWLVLFVGQIGAWLLLVIKAYQGETYRLPVIGDLAAKQV